MASQGKLAAALAAAPAFRKGPQCGVAIVIAKLEGADQAEFLEALRDPAVSSRNLCAALKSAYGIQLQYATLIRHRGGNCQCQG
jgi:hypothetical protein